MDKRTDEDIIREIVERGRHDQFGVLYDRYSSKVYHKCLSFAKNSDDAQDMLHDVFLKTFSKLSAFSGRSSFSTWLYSITYNFCVDYSRKKSKMRTQDIDEMRDIDDKEDEQNEGMLMNIRAERLSSVLANIDPKSKMMLLMKFQDGFSLKEIMDMLDLGESAVKMRIKRAKAQAMAKYQEMYPEL